MAAPAKPSRWGSLLSQAVAGVESRLDTILADGGTVEAQQADDKTQAAPQQQQQQTTKNAPTPSSQPNLELARNGTPRPVTSRTSSHGRTNDRLQARLAKAMVAKNGPVGTSPRSSIDISSRKSMDGNAVEEKEHEEKAEAPAREKLEPEPSMASPEAPASIATLQDTGVGNHDRFEERPSITITDDETTVTTTEMPPNELETEVVPPEANEVEVPPTVLAIPPADVVQLTQDMEEIKLRQEEEIQDYIERIDSLQAKLQYLSKSAAETAKKSASSAPAGTAEKKLAEKDEKIALLMEEGQKLSIAEQKLRNTIRKLRSQIYDHEKSSAELKASTKKAQDDAESLRARMQNGEDGSKKQDAAYKTTATLQKQIDTLKKEQAAKEETIRRSEQESKQKLAQMEASHTQALKKVMADGRSKQKELEDSMTELQSEREATRSEAVREAAERHEKLDRAVSRGKTVETELKTELSAMERRLEAMRTSAEEAVSGAGGDDGQLKLVRQMETLQSQYTTASDNWQGIEASLLAKVSNLEKEKDEAHRRESEMRKRAREASSRCKRLEEELQDLQPDHVNTQQELDTCKEQLSTLRTSMKNMEATLEQARTDLEKQQRVATREVSADAARQRWADDVAAAANKPHSRPGSPMIPISRTFSSDLIGSLPVPSRSRRIATPRSGSIPDTPTDGISPGFGLGISQRVPSQPTSRANTNSAASFGHLGASYSPFEPPAESPSLPFPPHIERAESVADTNPASVRDVAQDMISVSTVGAGPSVQLVERMSAAIRRLEAEKVAAKEEMTRVCNQRDEARNEMLGLMKNMEEAKASVASVKRMKEEVAETHSRYQTTLEMLGEKSELVEELKADVQDMKVMYRELVERAVK